MAKKRKIINTATDLQDALTELVHGIGHAHDRARDMTLLDFEELRRLRAASGQISDVIEAVNLRLEAIREAREKRKARQEND